MFSVISLLLCVFLSAKAQLHGHEWLVNQPADFHNRNSHVGDSLIDVRNNSQELSQFVKILESHLPYVDGFTDGEVIDALEHYFWGQKNGLAIELGALDGSPKTRSQTYEYEKSIGWRRILVEGNPAYKQQLITNSPLAFSANAPICSHHQTLHFSEAEYTGGIIEFMGPDFFKNYHPNIYKAGIPPGNLSSIDWSKHSNVRSIDCVPMSKILSAARARHVNFFILDVEGAEFEVLSSINWSLVKFDVLCIETDPENRPKGYADKLTTYLAERGYVDHSGQVGRNIWYIHKEFKPFSRPGLAKDCYNGYNKADNADKRWSNKRHPAFQACPIST